MKYRYANSNEAEKLTDLALRSKSIWSYSKDYIAKCRPALQLKSKDISRWPVVILEENEKPIGFFCLKRVDNENRLDHLWIEPDQIRRGYGTLLFKKAILEARELGWKSFRLAADPPAEGFYKKQGAVTLGEVQSRIKPDLFLPHMEFIL